MTRKYKQIKINRNGDRTYSKAGYGWDNGSVAFSNPLEHTGKYKKARKKKKSNDLHTRKETDTRHTQVHDSNR